MSTPVIDLDLSQPMRDLIGLVGCSKALVIARWRRLPLGRLVMEVHGGRIRAEDLCWAASRELGSLMIPHVVRDLLGMRRDGVNGLVHPSCSVIICTRDRTEDLRRCLDGLLATVGADVEVLVVDNAPSDGQTATLVARYPVRYVREPRPGLSWARDCGARAASGEVLAYIDDDVVVEPGWLEALLESFRDPTVAAVSGLVMPLEMETASQELFEHHQGFWRRGFMRREASAVSLSPLGAGALGAGACMAFRRRLVTDLGFFRVELGAGTPARAGEETYALYRLMSLGYRIVYHPAAMVWHRHRQTTEALQRTLSGYTTGVFVMLLRCLLAHGELSALATGWRWFAQHHVRQLWRGLRRRADAQPLWMTWAEILGALAAPAAYVTSRWRERTWKPAGGHA